MTIKNISVEDNLIFVGFQQHLFTVMKGQKVFVRRGKEREEEKARQKGRGEMRWRQLKGKCRSQADDAWEREKEMRTEKGREE